MTGRESTLLRQFQERRLAGIILTGFAIGQESAVREWSRAAYVCRHLGDAGGQLTQFRGLQQFYRRLLHDRVFDSAEA